MFCQLLMADEINRASPRTQSALLQAMQEHRVSVAGHYYPLPTPFHVLATQNPLEQEGTYPLPEAQLDRFLMQVDVEYPDLQAERRVLLATTGPVEEAPVRVMDGAQLLEAQRLIRHVPVGESVVEAILELVRAGRPETSPLAEVAAHVAWGPGPRASQALMRAVRARAVIQGRLAPSVDDVVALAHPVLRHRMALTFTARAEGVAIGEIIDRLVAGSDEQATPAGIRQRPDDPATPASPRRLSRAEALAAVLPPLLVAAERVAATVSQGVHGRRRVGDGETFWQFRRYQPGDPAHADRLAPVGEVGPGLCPRDRMGGGAERLAVARRLRVDALAGARAGCPPSWSGRSCCAGAGRAAGPRRRARGAARRRPDRRPAASALQRLAVASRAGTTRRRHPACRKPSRCRAMAGWC